MKLRTRRLELCLVVTLCAAVLPAAGNVRAQNPAAQNPPAQNPQPGARGGGRGRVIQVMTLTSPAWPDGGRIPAKHAQPGGDVSPPLAWTGAPEGTLSYVLIVHDLDAPVGAGIDDALHWLVWNIPGAATGLPEGVPQGAALPDGSRQISVTGPSYRGPAAPASGPLHHYVFELYALDVAKVDATIDIPANPSPAQWRAAIVMTMAGHVRGKGVYTGTYKRGD